MHCTYNYSPILAIDGAQKGGYVINPNYDKDELLIYNGQDGIITLINSYTWVDEHGTWICRIAENL